MLMKNLRLRNIPIEIIELLKTRICFPNPNYITLAPTLKQVELLNSNYVNSFSEFTTYHAIDLVKNILQSNDFNTYSCVEDKIPLLKKIQLAIGMRVLLIQNIKNDIVTLTNGMFATVQSLCSYSIKVIFDDYPLNEFEIPYSVYTDTGTGFERLQLPFMPVAAATINRIQSQTLEGINIYINPLFTHGQCYSGLGRSTTFTNIHILNDFTLEDITFNDEEVFQFYESKGLL